MKIQDAGQPAVDARYHVQAEVLQGQRATCHLSQVVLGHFAYMRVQTGNEPVAAEHAFDHGALGLASLVLRGQGTEEGTEELGVRIDRGRQILVVDEGRVGRLVERQVVSEPEGTESFVVLRQFRDAGTGEVGGGVQALAHRGMVESLGVSGSRTRAGMMGDEAGEGRAILFAVHGRRYRFAWSSAGAAAPGPSAMPKSV